MATGKNTLVEVRNIIENTLNIPVGIEKVRAIGCGILIRVHSLKNKIRIMKWKAEFKGTNIWIEDDLSLRERSAQEWLREMAAAIGKTRKGGQSWVSKNKNRRWHRGGEKRRSER